MSDRIAVRGIEVFAHHGVFDQEKADGQLFSIDVEIDVDLAEAARSDALAATVDYGRLAEQIHERVSTERWNLIETVAQRVADLVLEDSRVQGVTVTVHKPQAPISVPFRDVAVTVHRTR